MKGAGKRTIEMFQSNSFFFSQGTNERALIDIIANRSNVQRQQIKLQYKTMYGVVCIIVNSIKHKHDLNL